MDDKKQQFDLDSLRIEYSEANENFRHFSTLRFAVFTVFFAVEAGFAYVAFDPTNYGKYTTLAKLGAILVTLVFWSYQERIVRLITHFMKVAAEIETKLDYTLISSRPLAKFPVWDLNTTTRIFFPIVILFWAYMLFVP